MLTFTPRMDPGEERRPAGFVTLRCVMTLQTEQLKKPALTPLGFRRLGPGFGGLGLAAAQLVVLQAQARAVCRLEWGRVSRCLAPLVAPVCGGLSGGGRQPSPSLSGCQWVQATLQGGEGDAVSRAGESLGLHKCPQARYD